MQTLRDWQYAMRASLIGREPAITQSLARGVSADRLDIYRNTIFSALTRALRLAYPATERLVGADFFDGAADIFIRTHLPRTAYLDQYGDEFPDFLQSFAPAARLPYLADVARLEWAVNRALHAVDETTFELAQLAAVGAEDRGRVRFRPRASISLLRTQYPADHIWRAVLNRDDKALAAIDLRTGPVFLLIERGEDGMEVIRMQEPAWRFLSALCKGEPLEAVIEAARDIDAPTALAEHLAAGRFVAFTLSVPAMEKTREILA
ncbi:MAG: putative DNA-binding domain-containing protein [Pseudolabrys sp.]|nr:putative DNA-binding domain-containing protein [Pseudolabrys sp.]